MGNDVSAETHGRVVLSPQHEVVLAPEFADFVEHPSDHDIVLFTLSRKMANGEPLIQGELVLAGKETRNQFEQARKYPVHFRKTYYPTCFHQDPAREVESLNRASEILGIPPAIGATRTTFRSCFIPGRPFDQLSPFGVEPDERNIDIAKEETTPAALMGLWHLLENLYGQLTLLHQGGLAHGDVFLHNAIVSLSPIDVTLIDFELAKRQEDLDEKGWEKARFEDLREVLREAIFVQCGLGKQRSPLAKASRAALEELFGRNAGRYRRAIEGGSGGKGTTRHIAGHKVRARSDVRSGKL